MSFTIKNLIQDSVQAVLGLERDPIPTDIRDLALAEINRQGRIIFDAWPWDNSKIDEFTAPASDADGIITFAATVDAIRALRPVSATSDIYTPIFAQDEVLAAMQGEQVSSSQFQYLADDGSGNRRIRVPEQSTGNLYKVLALKRFVPYTTTTYLTDGFVIDRAESALRAFLDDALRVWAGYPRMNDGPRLLDMALNRERQQQQRENRVNPRFPMFGDDDERYASDTRYWR